MKLSKEYDYYFENKGLCPECNHLLTMHVGCINVFCPLCQKMMGESELMSKRVWGFRRKMLKITEEYKEFKKKYGEKRKENLDKCQEKKYVKVKY